MGDVNVDVRLDIVTDVLESTFDSLHRKDKKAWILCNTRAGKNKSTGGLRTF